MRRRSFCMLLVAVLMLVVLAVGSADAASILLGGKKKKTAAADPNLGDADNPVDITLDDGLRVEFGDVPVEIERRQAPGLEAGGYIVPTIK